MTFIANICTAANRIDLVFDSYIEGSVKDAERIRRCKSSPIDLSEMQAGTSDSVGWEILVLTCEQG